MVVESGCTVCGALEALEQQDAGASGLFVAGYICGRYDEKTAAGIVLCQAHADLMSRMSKAMSAETVRLDLNPAGAPS